MLIFEDLCFLDKKEITIDYIDQTICTYYTNICTCKNRNNKIITSKFKKSK